MNPESSSQSPPTWALEPATAWIYFAVQVVLTFSPVWFLSFVLAVVAAVFTYQDRRAHGFPAFWWTAAVVAFGALAYLFFVYRRPREAVVYSPEAAVAQQARLVRGLPPQPSAAGPGASAPADWYPDPQGEARLRYWNGTEWTDHTAA